MSRGATRYPKVRTEDEMILGEPIRDGSDDPVVARGEGEIVTLASEPRKLPPTVIDPFVAKKQRVLTQALGYNPRTRTVPIPDNHPPRNLASTFMKALKVHKIDYEIFNVTNFTSRKFDSTNTTALTDLAPLLSRDLAKQQQSNTNTATTTTNTGRHNGNKHLQTNSNSRVARTGFGGRSAELLFLENNVTKLFRAGGGEGADLQSARGDVFQREHARQMQAIKEEQRELEEQKRKRLSFLRQVKEGLDITKDRKVNQRKLVRIRIDAAEKRKDLSKYSNSSLKDSVSSTARSKSGFRTGSHWGINTELKELLNEKPEEVYIEDLRDSMYNSKPLTHRVVNPFCVEKILQMRRAKAEWEIEDPMRRRLAIQQTFFQNIMTGYRDRNEQYRKKHILTTSSPNLHELSTDEVFNLMFRESRSSQRFSSSQEESQLLSLEASRVKLDTSERKINDFRRTIKKLTQGATDRRVGMTHRTALSKTGEIADIMGYKILKQQLTQLVDRHSAEQALVSQRSHVASIQGDFRSGDSHSWVVNPPEQQPPSPRKTLKVRGARSVAKEAALLESRCKDIIQLRRDYAKVRAAQVGEFEKRVMALEDHRILKRRLEKSVLNQVIDQSRVTKKDQGLAAVRKQVESTRDQVFQNKEYLEHVGFYNRLLNTFETQLLEFQPKLVMLFKDLIDYHRLILSEGVVLTITDAENIRDYISWIGLSQLKPAEKTVLKVLNRFYVDNEIIGEGFFPEEMTKTVAV